MARSGDCQPGPEGCCIPLLAPNLGTWLKSGKLGVEWGTQTTVSCPKPSPSSAWACLSGSGNPAGGGSQALPLARSRARWSLQYDRSGPGSGPRGLGSEPLRTQWREVLAAGAGPRGRPELAAGHQEVFSAVRPSLFLVRLPAQHESHLGDLGELVLCSSKVEL